MEAKSECRGRGAAEPAEPADAYAADAEAAADADAAISSEEDDAEALHDATLKRRREEDEHAYGEWCSTYVPSDEQRAINEAVENDRDDYYGHNGYE